MFGVEYFFSFKKTFMYTSKNKKISIFFHRKLSLENVYISLISIDKKYVFDERKVKNL